MVPVRQRTEVTHGAADHLSLSGGRQLGGDGDGTVEVRDAVTVVVDLVRAAAQVRQVLRSRRARRARSRSSVDAGRRAAEAGADSAGDCPLIDRPVAIIVDAVAGL